MAQRDVPDDVLDALVDAARSGGGWACERLWAQLSPSVLGYVRGRGAPDPEDVVSEVFLAVFRGLPGFVGDGRAFRAWLFTIAHHRAADAVRRAARARAVAYDRDLDPRTVPSAEQEALAAVGDPALAAALATLSAPQREVLLLRTVADLSLEEVATVTGRTLGAVKALQHRAVAAVRRHLDAPVSPTAAPTMTGPR